MNVCFIGTENSLTVLVNNKPYGVDSTSPNWDTILQKLNNEDYEGLEELLSVKKTVETFFAGTEGVEVDDNGVKYNGSYVHNYLTGKIIDFQKRGLPYKPLLNFFNKVMKNPSHRAVNELYKFLEHGLMPITPEGNFLGYKSVQKDYKDWYSSKFDNSIGQTLAMERNQVCDDPDQGCSYGFHVGTLDYAKNFNHNNRVVIVEVDPADVVSVPHDCGHQKLRTAKYTVVGEFEKPLDNDFSDEYNKEDKQSEIEELEAELEYLRDELRVGASTMSSGKLRDLAEQIEELEDTLEELQLNEDEDEDEDDEDEDDCECPYHNHRDDKGRFCKKN